jgi:hypothetical protein
MTTPDPNSIGPHRPDSVRGWLVFEWLPPDLQAAEDATAEADYRRVRMMGSVAAPMMRGPLTRPATPTERLLLEHLGLELPERLATWVSYPSPGVRRRTWPVLHITDPPWTSAELAGMTPDKEFLDDWEKLTGGDQS